MIVYWYQFSFCDVTAHTDPRKRSTRDLVTTQNFYSKAGGTAEQYELCIAVSGLTPRRQRWAETDIA